ncbi:uncharacterized protein EI90DRAFT_2101510 [Cantharellus anzutake]|uniref:uncharacterized protein n=1 Tax=Cantharellus anzutake TaxID=1750568 RepID=UPI0019034E16|nr:uncharacterized protein EI90DRAFT_2101510 [Cantharellus anzutake]KAF8340704.1 hypothetical protein EI90DRAFT_2101510 [Cantharellus anzutake]
MSCESLRLLSLICSLNEALTATPSLTPTSHSTTSTTLSTPSPSTPSVSSAAPTSPVQQTTTSTSSTSSSTSISTTTSTSTSTSRSTSTTASTTSTSTTTTTTSTTPTSTRSVSTVTIVVPPSGSTTTAATLTSTQTSTHVSSGFFSNTGAVAGVFTGVGLVGLGLIVGFIVLMIKKKRARELDKEIAAAAFEANIQAGRNNAAIDEMDWDDHYPPSSGTHGAYGQPPMPMGYNNTTYDPYSENAYPMTARRLSQGTAVSAGFAGVGARGAAAGDRWNNKAPQTGGYAAAPQGEQYQNPYQTLSNESSGNGGQYGAPRPSSPPQPAAYDPFAATRPQPGVYNAQSRQLSPPMDPMSGAPGSHGQHDQDYDDAYGGVEEYDDGGGQGAPQYTEHDAENGRGSLQDDYLEEGHRVLKVTN